VLGIKAFHKEEIIVLPGGIVLTGDTCMLYRGLKFQRQISCASVF
jgi:hypothetical protein